MTSAACVICFLFLCTADCFLMNAWKFVCKSNSFGLTISLGAYLWFTGYLSVLCKCLSERRHLQGYISFWASNVTGTPFPHALYFPVYLYQPRLVIRNFPAHSCSFFASLVFFWGDWSFRWVTPTCISVLFVLK